MITEENLVKHCRTAPVWFARHVLGVDLWGKQAELLKRACKRPTGATRIAVRSCHGAGKSFGLAVLTLYFLSVWPESIAIITATTFDQALSTIWAEVRKLFAQSLIPLGGQMLSTQWNIGPKHFAHVVSPNKPDSASGIHAPHVLQIVDEASSLDAVMAEAFEGNMSSGHVELVYSGNPLRPSGPFYESFRGPISDEWEHLHISAFDLPSGVPGLTTKEWIDLRRKEWGEGSPAWQARVLGEFPSAAEDALIPLSLVEEAEIRRVEENGPRWLGADTARFGGDETVFVVRDSYGILHIEGHRGWRETEIAGAINHLIKEFDVEPQRVHIDNTGGYGAGAVDILHEQGVPIDGFNFGGKAADEEQFANVRAEMYWMAMLALRDEGFSLKGAGSALGGQLAAIHKSFDSKGRIKLEPKEKVKARVGRSPDHADAFALTFAPGPKPKPGVNVTLL